jgi:hypothetical protein
VDNHPNQNPDQAPLDELKQPLRKAVEQVRAQLVPPEAQERALDKARTLRATKPRVQRPRFRRDLLAVAGLAASVMIGLAIWHNWPQPKREVAHAPEDLSVVRREATIGGGGTHKPLDANFDEESPRDGHVTIGGSAERDKDARDMKPGDPVGGVSRIHSESTPQAPPGPGITNGTGSGQGRSSDGGGGFGPAGRPGGPGGPPGDQDEPTRRRMIEEATKRLESMKQNEERVPGSRSQVDIAEATRQLERLKQSGAHPTPPRSDSNGGDNKGPGRVDETRLKQLAEDWGKMPAKDREKAIEELKRDKISVPSDFKVGDFDAFAAEKGKDQKGDGKGGEDKGGAGKEQKAGEGKGEPEGERNKKETKSDPVAKKNQAPKVWRRGAGRPTFARVYVGDGNSLELVSLQVSVTVEGPRARTVVDHVFRNPHDRRLEGTFEYPLPTGASPSYFAMFLGQTRDTVPPRFARRGDEPALPQEALARLTPNELVKQINTADWGNLQEARVVNNQKALETYEEVVRGRIDPALLEYAGGNTFRGRVFPIPPKGYNRVLISYEELLPITGDQELYRFLLPDCELTEMGFTLQANAAECKNPVFLPKDVKKDEGGSRFLYSKTWTNTQPEGEVRFAFTPARPDVQYVTGRQGENGPHYVYARLRPDLKQVAADKPFASHAVFLLDTSLSEHPDRFGVNVKLMRKILESDPDVKQFNVLTFNVGSAWLEPKGWLPNTKEGREKMLAKLDGIVLEGATDLSAALEGLTHPSFDVDAGTPINCFLLSDGHVTWGESDVNKLVARFDNRCPFPTHFHCYRTGIGAENQELFTALTRKGGGVFNCFTEADLANAAKAHRTQCLQVERVRFVSGPEASDVLIAGRQAAVYPGGELIVAAKTAGAGRTTLLVEGTFLGQKYAQEVPLDVTPAGELAARGWAETAVASLLALNDAKLDGLVTAYCQQYGIASRVASFLVLENEADYKRFNLDDERGRTVTRDMGRFLEDAWHKLGEIVPAREGFVQFLNRIEGRVHLLNGPNSAHVQKLLSVLQEKDFDLPDGQVAGAIVRKADVSPAYLSARDRDRRDVHPFLSESHRRANAGDTDGSVRVLSSIVEEHQGRSDALRLVGYRLLDLKRSDLAARLFTQVERQRPFEPHSYRDLARSLEDCGMFGLAAIQYEIMLAGTWHNRFGASLKLVAQEEYAHMMQDAIRRKAVPQALAQQFGERLENMALPNPKSDLRVTISWNTDATDVDLWVIEPDGTKCYYQHNRTKNGGELSQDQTQGYGPERYQVAKALEGTYTVIVHYYSANPNLLAGETHVNVVVTRDAGTAREKSERHTVILKKKDEQVEVAKVKF